MIPRHSPAAMGLSVRGGSIHVILATAEQKSSTSSPAETWRTVLYSVFATWHFCKQCKRLDVAKHAHSTAQTSREPAPLKL